MEQSGNSASVRNAIPATLAQPGAARFWLGHLLALTSLVFLTSGVLSYAAMRSIGNIRLEQYADVAFILGLTLLSLSTVFMAVVIK